jgi:5'-methylthioadenosine phosphorylase
MDDSPLFAVIGGTGLYSMPDLEDVIDYDLDTPFGKPSAPIVAGRLQGVVVAFLARHGLSHSLMPSEINFRANIYALKMLGVRKIVSINAVGSLREDYAPGDIVIPDQLFDFTRDRKRTFFGEGVTAHISVADPFCEELSSHIAMSLDDCGVTVHKGGTFITVEGPRFSTKGESNVFRLWGMSIIGMNTSPEAFLAREAEMAFAVLAHVTDYDVWHISDEPVTVEIVLKRLADNIEISRQAVRKLAANHDLGHTCSCEEALANAIITPPEAITSITRERLALIINKYIP